MKMVGGLSVTINSDVLKKMEGIPVLGRGYSVSTNTLHSTCLEVDLTANGQSYNYQCELLVSNDHLV